MSELGSLKSSYFHFGQVLDVITPPYTSDFVQLFLPILENDSIAGTIRTEGEHDPVAEFIGELSTVIFVFLFLVCLTRVGAQLCWTVALQQLIEMNHDLHEFTIMLIYTYSTFLLIYNFVL